MKVLAVTGRIAQDWVREFAGDADVLVLELDIAAFITPDMLLRAAPKGYDLILIPGAITTDFAKVEDVLGTKIRLGPKHAADLGFVLGHLDDIELSRSIPACVLLEDRMHKDALTQLQRLETEVEPALTINGIKIGGRSRMKVLAEIVDSTRLSPVELTKKIHYYGDQGADMIDLSLPFDTNPTQVAVTVKAAKMATELPISIDTLRPELIIKGVEAGADLVLSLNGDSVPLIGDEVFQAGATAVVISGPGKTSLEENLKSAQELGIKVIADPVLNPPLQGMALSLEGYLKFKEAHPDIPLFFGAGNVTELIDADSQGVNVLLAALGAEVGASILFTPEYSPKARGSVRELRTASEMMLLAATRRTTPKDLGIDLLVLKEKRHRLEDTIPNKFLEARANHQCKIDPAGSFRISIADGKIVARHEKENVVGTNAKDVLNTLIDCGLVTRLDHAGYLGRELQKAEIALSLGRSYSQEDPLLPDKS